MISGKLEITIKINELPTAVAVENGWQQLEIDCDGRIITMVVKPKVFKKLTDAQANFPVRGWVRSLAKWESQLKMVLCC
jgi:hypothetical protein